MYLPKICLNWIAVQHPVIQVPMGKALQSKQEAGRSEEGLGMLSPPRSADHNSQKQSDSQTTNVKVTQPCPTLCTPWTLWPHGLYSPWDSPGQNTGVGRLSLLQGIFPTGGSNCSLLHCRRILYQQSYQGSPTDQEGLLKQDPVSVSCHFVLCFPYGPWETTIYLSPSHFL